MDATRPALLVLPGLDMGAELGAFIESLETAIQVDLVPANLHGDSKPGFDELLLASSLLVLAGGGIAEWTKDDVRTALEIDGTRPWADCDVLIAVGAAAAVLGSWTVDPTSDTLAAGWEMLPNAVVLPGEGAPLSLTSVRRVLESVERSYAVGLPWGAALALGPEGEVEALGSERPVISLGQGWQA
jgi:hypothetical protein